MYVFLFWTRGDFEKSVDRIRKDDANDLGVAKICFPDEWKPITGGFSEEMLNNWDKPICRPIIQPFQKIENGVYLATFDHFDPPMKGS